jgi:hypothetical protein
MDQGLPALLMLAGLLWLLLLLFLLLVVVGVGAPRSAAPAPSAARAAAAAAARTRMPATAAWSHAPRQRDSNTLCLPKATSCSHSPRPCRQTSASDLVTPWWGGPMVHKIPVDFAQLMI